MAEDGSALVAIRAANAPKDLRRVGAHPDHWYPLAWSEELKPGKVLGRRFADQPIALFRGTDGKVVALEDRCAHRQVPLHLGVVCGNELKCHYHGWAYDAAGKCVDVPYLGKERLPNGVKSYPAREIDGLIFVFPGDPVLAAGRVPSTLGASQRKDYKTRRLNRQVACHYTFMHENLFDMNHQFMHRKQMGSIKARCIGRDHGADWAQVEYTFSRTEGKASLGEQVIVDLVRKRNESKRISPIACASVPTIRPRACGCGWVANQGHAGSCARCLARLYAARCRAAHQPHVWIFVRQEAARARPHPCRVAVRRLVHGKYLRRRQGHRRARAARL